MAASMALDNADFDLYPGEILAVIGDNGAGKSSLIRALSGALVPDSGEIRLDGGRSRSARRSTLRRPASRRSIKRSHCRRACRSPTTCFSAANCAGRARSARSAACSIARPCSASRARSSPSLVCMTVQNINQRVETLSGGQRQGVAVARAAAFGSRVVIMDEPTAALGVKESRRVLELILDVRRRGVSMVLISHNMPHVFEIADRIHIHRLGRRLTVIDPKAYTMSDAVAFMTGARAPTEVAA